MSDLFIGPNRISVDIETRAGVVIGPGPLMTVLSLEYGYRLSESGDFSAVVALSDPRAVLIVPKEVVLAFYFDNELIFRGVVEHTTKSVDQAGVLRLTVRGRDLTGELAESPIGDLELVSGGAGVTNGPQQILTAANTFNGTTWVLSADGHNTTLASIYGKYSGESALTALIMAAQKSGEHFRVATDGTRKIVWLRTDTDDSGVRAIQTAGEPVQAENNPFICFIQRFEEQTDAYRLITRIYPYGAGDGDARLTLASSTRGSPVGFTTDEENNFISSNLAVSAIGKDIAVNVRFQDIRPVSNTSADITAASNQLFDAAFEYLKRHDAANDLKTFRLTVLKLPSRVQVGEIVTVEYQDQGYVVDGEQMVVLAIRNRIDSSGVRVSELTVAGVARWQEDVSREIVGGMEQSKLFTSHPQRGPNSYVTSYQSHVWRDGADSEIAKVRFRFGPEICQLNQVAFDFDTDNGTRMLPLESTVRSVAGSSTTTSSGGSSTPTTSSGGSSSPTTSSGGGSAPTSSGGSSHTHGITIPSHSHDIPDHNHQITVAGGTGGDNLQVADIGGGTGVLTKLTAGDVKVNTNPDTGAVTSDDGGAVVTSSGAEGAHTHTVTISSHQHSVTIPNHDHTVTIGGHTHDVTANVSTEYGVYREVDALTFNLADLEYQVNGGGWNDLSVDAVSLESNWYRLDITESLYDANFVPLQANNLLEFRRKTSGSFGTRVSCLIDGQLLVRNIIQSVSLT